MITKNQLNFVRLNETFWLIRKSGLLAEMTVSDPKELEDISNFGVGIVVQFDGKFLALIQRGEQSYSEWAETASAAATKVFGRAA